MNLFFAFALRDFAVEKNYRFAFAVKALNIIFQLAIFFFLSRFLEKPEYFAFVLVGLIFSRFFQFWLGVMLENIRQEQYWGTAELLFLAPKPVFKVVLASVAGKFLMMIAEIAVYLAAGILFFGAGVVINVFLIVPVFLNSAAFAGLGLMSAGFIMYYKRGDPVNWVIAGSFDLLSGVYFPLSVLPDFLQKISRVLPTTSALEAWREILLSGRNPSADSLVIQAVWAAALMAVGAAAFAFACRLARKNGEVGSY